MDGIEVIPEGSKRIYSVNIKGDIIRVKYKKKYKEKFSFTQECYKEGEEKNPESYFMKTIKHKLGLEKDDEEFKITEIVKIKEIGFSVPPIQ